MLMRRDQSHVAPGMTVVEILVVIATMATLGAILLTSLRGVRDSATQLNCLTNIRNFGAFVAAYTHDHHDFFPSWIERGVDYEGNPDLWDEYASQTYTVLQSDRWLEYTGFDRTTPTMYCPANQWWPEMYSVHHAPDYLITASSHARPEYLDPGLPTSLGWTRLGGQVQRMTRTRYPSAKAALYELAVWHGWRGVWVEGTEAGSLQYWQSRMPGSVFFIDGHAESVYERDGTRPLFRYPIWPYHTFGTTPHGILGRDVP